MATFEVTDPQTGRKVRLTGDSPPSEAELEEIFASLPVQQGLGAQVEQARQQQTQLEQQIGQVTPLQPGTQEAIQQTLGGLPIGGLPQPPIPDPRAFGGGEFDPTVQPTPLSAEERSKLGQSAGGIVGAISAARKADVVAKALPGPIRATVDVAAGAIGAFAGGATGDLLQAGTEKLAGSEFAAEGIGQALNNALAAGGEEAVIDLIGNLGFRAVRGGLRALRPKAAENAAQITAILERGGSGPALDQITNNSFYDNLSGIVRGALIGSEKFKKLDLAQDVALASFSKQYAEEIGGIAANELTDTAIGKMFLDTMQKGKGAHSEAAGTLYANLDDLVPPLPVTRVGAGAGPEVVLPVDLSGVKKAAQEQVDQLRRIGDVGKAGDGGTTLDSLLRADDRLLFSDAHKLRSNLMSMSRALTEARKGDPIAATLSSLSREVDKAMDSAGRALSPQGLKQYRNASKFWKFGEENFNNDVMISLMKKSDTPTRLGEKLFSVGNFDEINKVRRAMKVASKLDKSIDFDAVWKKVQGGFINRMVPESADQVLTSPFRKLHRDQKALKTMTALFNKTDRGAIKEMSKAFDDILLKRGERGFLNLRQAGAAAQVAGGISAGATAGLAEASLFVIAPLLFSLVAARPSAARAWVKWTKANPRTPAKFAAAVKFARVVGISVDELRNISGEDSVPVKGQQQARPIPQGNTGRSR